MPDDLYERDVLAWSQHQADLLRRLGRGERVNDVDWAHVAEIGDVGLSELHSVQNFLNLIMVHLLKHYAWHDHQACGHWRSEIVGFQRDLKRRFSPSMRQRISLDELYGDAIGQLRAGDSEISLPAENPFALDQLLTEDISTLLNRLCPTP